MSKDLMASSELPECDFIGENCIVALEMSNHVPGCKMVITGDKPVKE